MAQWNSQQFHLRAAWNYSRMENNAACALKFAFCGLRHTLGRRQTASCMGFSCIGSFTQRASEIAENSITPLVKMQRKLKYVQLGAARGLRQSMNRPLSPSCSLRCRMLPVSFCLRWSNLLLSSEFKGRPIAEFKGRLTSMIFILYSVLRWSTYYGKQITMFCFKHIVLFTGSN